MNQPIYIHLIPEWSPQSSVWVGWPTLEDEWGETFSDARREIAGFVEALSQHIAVNLVAGTAHAAEAARAACHHRAAIRQLPLGDIWLRDTGPVIIQRNDVSQALCFDFDGWGGKFVMPGDTETGAAIASELGLPIERPGYVLEGGAIEIDGAHNLITTRQCLLDGVRNPTWTEADSESALNRALGKQNIIWLDRGLMNDHTDGHVDNLARFIAPGHVICQTASGSDDPNAEVLANIEAQLRASGFNVDTLPSPGAIELDGKIAPASHMNFLITNGAVLLPVFEEVYAPKAVDALSGFFPDRSIIPLPAKNILSGGGTFHCMTREVPDFSGLEVST